MAISPTSLNTHVDTARLLAQTGSVVKAGQSNRSSCPLCQGTLYQYPDPIGGSWFTCDGTCKFSGDGIELFQRAGKFKTIVETVRAMEASQCLPAYAGSGLKVAQYEMDVLGLRRDVEEFWAKSREDGDVTSATSAAVSIYQMCALWPGYGTGSWAKSFGRFIGASTKQQIKDLPIESGSVLPREIAPFNRSPVLVIPSFDLPGRIRAFYFVAPRGMDLKEMNIRPGGRPEYTDIGLTLLNALPLDLPETVFAIRDLHLLLQLQSRQALRGRKPLPVVGWHPGTTTAWNVLRPPRLILCDHRVTEDMLRVAIRNDAMISIYPELKTPLYPGSPVFGLGSVGDTQFMESLSNKARVWPEVLRDYLLANKPTAQYIVTSLNLSPAHSAALLAVTAADDLGDIDRLLTSASEHKAYGFAGRLLVETHDGSYEAGKEGREDGRILDVRWRIARQTRYTGQGRTVLEGQVLTADGRSLSFAVDREIVEQDPAGWLEKFVVSAGLPQPVVHPKYRKHLLEMVFAHCKPASLVVNDALGWSETLDAFSLPAVQVKAGAITSRPGEEDTGEPSNRYGRYFTAAMPSEDDIRRLLDTSRGQQLVLGMTLSVLHNVLAPITRWSMQPICVLEEEPSQFFRQLVAVMDLRVLRAAPETDSPCALPFGVVAPMSMKAIQKSIELTAGNLVLTLNETAAALLSFSCPVIGLQGRGSGTVDRALLSVLPAVLAYFQKNKREFLCAEHERTILSTVRGFRHWLKAAYDIAPADGDVELLFYPPGLDLTSPLPVRFIKLCQRLAARGKIKLEEVEGGTRIPFAPLNALCRQVGCPLLPIEKVADALLSSSNLLHLDGKSMVITAALWRSTLQPQ